MKYGFYMVFTLQNGREVEVRRSFTHKGIMWTGKMLQLANGIYFRRIEQKEGGFSEYPAATLHVTGNSATDHKVFHRRAGSNATGGNLSENMKLWVEEKPETHPEEPKKAKKKAPVRQEPSERERRGLPRDRRVPQGAESTLARLFSLASEEMHKKDGW